MGLVAAAVWSFGPALLSAAASFLAAALPGGQAFGTRGVALAGGAFGIESWTCRPREAADARVGPRDSGDELSSELEHSISSL